VAEKPSLAESIAKILSNNHMKTRRGIATNVHEFNGTLFGKQALFKMTSVMGHVYSLDFPREYNNWVTVNPIDLFDAPTIQLEANPKTHLIKHLRAESKGIDYLILWLDCDREGENICFEVMRNVMSNIKPQPNMSKKDCVYRARFSAVDVRQELDLKIGCCFTRYQTRYFQGKYGNLDSKLISYGPCQIPTLALCVKRHDEIMSFKPVPYWTLYLTVNVGGSIVKAVSTRGRIFEKNRVEGIKKIELLRAASVGLGMSPQETMSVAERLYMQGYISYPRTETTKFPANYDIRSVLQEHKNHYLWGTYANDLLVNGFKMPEGGVDAGDHSPITPTRMATENMLGHNEWRLYELVTRTFIGSLLPNMKYMKTDVTFEIGYETFTCSGKQIVEPGFASVMHWRSQQDENLPMIDKDATYPVVELNSNESETTPPDYLSEADLLGLMEKYGIGTDASMAVHIASICNRNYVNVQGTRRSLIPTRLGIVLIHGYPDMEKRIGLIAEGKAQFDSVLHDEIELYRSKFEWFVKKITNMDELFEATFSPLSSSGRPFSKCGKCRRYMHLIALKPTRLHCRYCNDTYALPNGGSIKLYNEIICPYDNFEVISYSNGTKGKGFPLCPYCYNNSPIEGIENVSCNKCTNPNCQLSLQKNGMFECPEDNCEGTMVLDNTLAPRYKIACNRCKLISCFTPEVHKVKLTDQLCDECSGKLISIEFIKKEGREPLTGCAICNDEINALLETK
ncbi:prokaryotic type I DNA topoisomerase, partial [Anaeromyces robustus]